MAKRKLNYEKTMQELQDILDEMSDSDMTLDDSIDKYAKAAKLIQECKTALDEAEVQIRTIDASLESLGDEDDG